MHIRVVGAHNLETRHTRHTCFVIDQAVAVDAGSLSAALEDDQRARLTAVLATHMHFDHVRDLPTLAVAASERGQRLTVYSLPETLTAIHQRLMDGRIYPDLTRAPQGVPPVCELAEVEPGSPFSVAGLHVDAAPMPHGAPSVAYIVWADSGACCAISGDTGGQLLPIFRHEPRPQVLFVELTLPTRLGPRARAAGHLTPGLLAAEVGAARTAGLPLPRMVVVHIGYSYREEILGEVAALRDDLGLDIEPGYEELEVTL